MKLITYQNQEKTSIGVDLGRKIIALPAAMRELAGTAAPEDMTAFIEAGPKLLKSAREAVAACVSAKGAEKRTLSKSGILQDAESIRRLAPLSPRAILCSGHNYWDHRDEKPPVPLDDPEFFLKLPQLTINPGDPIALDSKVTKKLDHETELAIVIGREGRHISAAKALDYVFGYTIMNDVTARDQQIRSNGNGGYNYFLGPGKNFDTSAPMGPCIVTADEIPDPQTLKLRSFVNGEARQNANTSQMIWGVKELVQFFSKFVTLRPGFVISSGTPGRTGWGWDPELGGKRAADKSKPSRLYLADGDVVRCEIEKIGVLENPVATANGRKRGK